MTYSLSHYTDRAGLEGIARSGTLWAGNFLSLNDTSEYFHGWAELQRAAAHHVLSRVPASAHAPGVDPEAVLTNLLQQYREMAAQGDGYGQLFITSFAVAQEDDHEQRGLLTLWDRYTHGKGYCLQFSRGDICSFIRQDAMRETYEFFELQDVTYGVDSQSRTFRELSRQFGEHLLWEHLRQRSDLNIEPDPRRWPLGRLAYELLLFCGRHKDRSFMDERECRILASPGNRTVPQFLTGVTFPKKIHSRPNGRKHIIIGEHWHPGISPHRIIIGPEADPDIEDIVRLFHKRPVVAQCNIPFRR